MAEAVMAELLKGKPVADEICRELMPRIEALADRNIHPALVIIRAGSSGSSEAYERAVEKRFEKLGLTVRKAVLPETASQESLAGVVKRISEDRGVDGILLLRPLPEHMDEDYILSLIPPEKDMDCVSHAALGELFCGGRGYAPCTAESCLKILDYYNVELSGKRAAVIGRSLVVGKPLSVMLEQRDATVTVCHSKTVNMAEICAQQDIIIAAAGSRGLVNGDFVRPGQVIIDVGINLDSDGKIQGDVDAPAVEGTVRALSPVPGGVGAVTTAVLAEHLVTAAERRN